MINTNSLPPRTSLLCIMCNMTIAPMLMSTDLHKAFTYFEKHLVLAKCTFYHSYSIFLQTHWSMK